MYKNIIFDADGTLFDTVDGIHEGFNELAKAFNLPLFSREQVMPFMGPSLAHTITTKLGFKGDDVTKSLILYRDFYWEKGYKMCSFYPGVEDLIKRLKADGKSLSVATLKPQPFIDAILKEKGYYDYFDKIVGPEMTNFTSDKTEFVLSAITDKSAVMVGDRYTDFIAAKNNGIDSIAVTWGCGDMEEFKQYKPTYVVDSADEIYKIVSNK